MKKEMKEQWIELTEEDKKIILDAEELTNTDYGMKDNKIEAWGLLSAIYELTDLYNYEKEEWERELQEEREMRYNHGRY